MTALALSAKARLAVQRFLAFHAELVEVKRLAGAATALESQDAEAAEGGAAPGLVDLFLRLRVAICPEGVPPVSTDGLPDIGYVMAALADEALLHDVDWPGREQWMGTLLENSLYGSKVSGEEIFTIAQGIVDGGITGRSDLAAAILLALSLGFRGRWRGAEDHGAIDRLRRGLYENLYRRPPSGIDWAAALPGALLPVLEDGGLRRAPRLAPWLLAMALSSLATLGLSHWMWTDAVRPLQELAVAIRALGARF